MKSYWWAISSIIAHSILYKHSITPDPFTLSLGRAALYCLHAVHFMPSAWESHNFIPLRIKNPVAFHHLHHLDTHPSGSLLTALPKWLTSSCTRRAQPKIQTLQLNFYGTSVGSLAFLRMWYRTEMGDSPMHFGLSCYTYWESNSEC